MATAGDLIILALKDAQILDENETPSSALMADSLTTLNQMLGFWQLEDINVYATIDQTFNPTGAETYTIGTGGVINVTRPRYINYAFYRESGIDYPILMLNTLREYQDIPFKAITTFPEFLFYNPTYPLGTIYLYPRPNTGTIHLGLAELFPIYAVSADAINLPPEYDMVIRYNLGVLLSAAFAQAMRPDLERLAMASMRILKRNNLRLVPLDARGYEDPLAPIYKGPYV